MEEGGTGDERHVVTKSSETFHDYPGKNQGNLSLFLQYSPPYVKNHALPLLRTVHIAIP